MQQTRQNDVDASPSSLLHAKLVITAIHASSSLGLEACIVWWIRCCCCPKRSRHPASSSSAACSSAASKRNLQKRGQKRLSQPGSAQLPKVWTRARQATIKRGFTEHHFLQSSRSKMDSIDFFFLLQNSTHSTPVHEPDGAGAVTN